jgi:putative membrane protein
MGQRRTEPRDHMKWGSVIAFVVGIGVLAALTVYAGAGGILRAFAALGISGLAIIVIIHLPVEALMGWAWWIIGEDLAQAAPRKFIWARFVRDAAAEALPLSQLGGFVFGVRALQLGRVSAIGGVLSMSVDLVMELWAKLPYFVAGLLTLLALSRGLHLWGSLSFVFGISAVLFAIPYVFRRRLRRWLERSALALARRWPHLGSPDEGTIFFDRLFAAPRRLVAGFALHLVCWFLGAAEAWVVFYLMGPRVTPLEALAIDSLAMGLRTFAFLVPAAAGIQEGGYVLVCALFGIAPASAIALSLARRARDIALGLPVLGAWQVIESRAHLSGADGKLSQH